MKVIFIKKKLLVNISVITILVLISILYVNSFGKGTITAFLNNEKVMPIHSVEVPDRRVAFTFDAAWGDQYTQDIVDILKRYNIKATFFLTGAWTDRYNHIVKDIYSNGHEIGNHSTTHVKFTGMQKEVIVSEVKGTENSIKKITGKNTKLFRVPFGDYDNKVIDIIRNLNYNIIQWDVDSLDWRGISAGDILDRVTSKTVSGSIILFHNNMANTPKALPDIIENLRRSGYKFVTVSELVLREIYYIDNTGRQKPLK